MVSIVMENEVRDIYLWLNEIGANELVNECDIMVIWVSLEMGAIMTWFKHCLLLNVRLENLFGLNLRM